MAAQSLQKRPTVTAKRRAMHDASANDRASGWRHTIRCDK